MTLPGLFVTGTDTGVGKTAVAAAIARALTREGRHVGVFKPVATGCTRTPAGLTSDDAARLAQATGLEPPLSRVVPHRFEPPLAPPVAAALEGVTLELEGLMRDWRDAVEWWSTRADVMVVEGVGGLLCPLAQAATVADFAVAVDYPLLIVARSSLGTLNHTLLTCEAARRRGLRIAGVVMNQPQPGAQDMAMMTNRNILAGWLEEVPLLASVEYHASVDDVVDAMRLVGWSARARSPRSMAHSSPLPELESR
jgi:dethiobiotin synthetase